ncbi:hypothetical protein ABTY96_21540 [Streptomyces sp. NPDC096057]|uniref:hypothetical protein n=1 Tax=Streptomyces sp. NPDC096057 TaxID=3155543 RepID=UPI003322E209
MSERFEIEPLDDELRDALRGLAAGQGHQHEVLGAVARRVGSLDTAVSTAHAEIAGVHSELAALTDELREVAQSVRVVDESVSQLRDNFAQFTERYVKDQARAAAEAELARLTLDWQSRFEQRRRTRALAHGLVHTLTRDAVERGVVDAAAVEVCAAERLLMEPSHWLAPAVVALAARYQGEAQRARRAVSHAYSLDPAKSNLFFALTCSRLGEFKEAARRMDQYLRSIDSYALDEDFQIVLDAVACRELGDDAHTYAELAMKRWAGQLDLARSDGGLDPVASHLWELRHRVPDDAFPELGRLCETEWDQLRRGWELASVPVSALEYLREQFPPEPVAWTESGTYAEGALGALIDRYDAEERVLDRRMEYLRRVIVHGGDVNEARRSVDVDDDAREPADLRTLLVNAVFVPRSVLLGGEARRLVLRTLWPRVLEAVQECADRAWHLLPRELAIGTDEWSAVVPADPSADVDAEPLVIELTGAVEDRTDRRVDAVQLNRVRLWGAGLLTLVASVLAFIMDAGTARVVCLCLGLGFTCWAAYEWRRVPVRRRELRAEGFGLARQRVRTLRRGLQQREEFFGAWTDHLRGSDELRTWGAESWREDDGT